jgi:hypothetical protein
VRATGESTCSSLEELLRAEVFVGVGELLTYREATDTQPSCDAMDTGAEADSSREPNRTRCAEAIFVVAQAVNQTAQSSKRHQEKAFTATPYDEMFRAQSGMR